MTASRKCGNQTYINLEVKINTSDRDVHMYISNSIYVCIYENVCTYMCIAI